MTQAAATRPKVTDADDYRILIVDDKEENRYTLSRRLRRIGFNCVIEAADGNEALDAMRGQEVHLVLCDIMMPVCDGFQVLETARQEQSLWDIPIIMISAVDEMDSIVRCIELGADDYLPKPFNPTLLRARVTSCFERFKLKQFEKSVRENYDPSTGLINRKRFLELLAEHDDLARDGLVIRIHLDQVKKILNTIDEDDLNSVLNEYATRLKVYFGQQGVLACFGPGEFGVMLDNATEAGHVAGIVSDLKALFQRPIKMCGTDLIGTASIGIGVPLADRLDAVDMLREAETALIEAEAEGGGAFKVSDGRYHDNLMYRIRLESDLRRATEREELELFYQPIVSIDSERVMGFEALMRWRHPVRGLVSPGEFIPISEESGAIVEMGTWALHEATRQLALWRAAFPELDLSMNVNVSARQFSESDLVTSAEICLQRHKVPAEKLKLEITESVAMGDPEHVREVLESLKSLGVARALDDFGTGFSSLSYLHSFPYSTLKVDRSFVKNIHSNPRNSSIVQLVIDLARDLGMDTVAEGIEYPEELEVLRSYGAHLAQGFLFGKPLPADEARAFLESQAST